jgi:hypothetical protein
MDEELEWAIDRAGRDKVLARAQQRGWPAGELAARVGLVADCARDHRRGKKGVYSAAPRVDNTSHPAPD